MSFKSLVTLCFSVVLFSQVSLAQNAMSHLEHEELGNVNWHRDYESALSLAEKSNKSVLILFQEVPGCATCRNYGNNVLSHPLMVEAIEELFVPLTVFNNKGGADKKVLDKYGEPTWNNPVVRIVDWQGQDLIPRINGNYTAANLLKNMRQSLIFSGASIPEYFKLLEQEISSTQSGETEEAIYQMHCFWTGEKELGIVDGVVNTESGFMNGREVVKVSYQPARVSKKKLDAVGKDNNFQAVPAKSNYRIASNDVHYYLQQSQYQFIPLSEIQKTKVNSALGNRQSPDKYLSPKQIAWLSSLQNRAKKNKSFIFTPIETAWTEME